MQKKYCLSLLSAVLSIGMFDACNESVEYRHASIGMLPNPTPSPLDPEDPDTSVVDLRPVSMMSQHGCQIDSDCVTGAFCFHGVCTTQCKRDEECAEGYVCSPRNGRCITESFANTMVLQEEDDNDSGLVTRRFALTDLNAQDLAESDASDVVEAVTNFEILTPPPSQIYIKPGQASASVQLVATQDYGDVDYLIRSVDRSTTSSLRRAKKTVNAATGMANYVFTVYPRSSSLGDQGKPEVMEIDSAIGNFEIRLLPISPVAGLYEGMAVANRMGGASFPVRFAVVTDPETPKTFAEIKGITLYMPSSQSDMFSPESVRDNSTQWAEIAMTKETNVKNCQSDTKCWSASFATNDFTMAGSSLINDSQKLNRAVRIEIDDFDIEKMRFFGYIKDDISGLYRHYDTQTGQKSWATASISGALSVQRTEKFSPEANSTHPHNMATDRNLRDIEDKSQIACSDEDIVSLMALAAADETLSQCADIATLDAWMADANRIQCISAAANSILSDENLTSRIITQLIARRDDDTTKVAGFDTLNDFLDNCLLRDGDPQKRVCIQRPEVSCAAELSAYAFLNTERTDDKETLMGIFHDLLRESYLGMQYAAWQQDITTRQKWLDTSNAPKFAAKEIENAIMDILDDWENDVLKAHLGVIGKQFGQYPLEVLSNLTARTDEIDAERYTILSDYQQAWQSVSDAVSVSLRRNNELLTKTTERKSKAAEYYPHLFDLYFAGLVESDINKNTGNTSLNGGYGNSFYQNLMTLTRLDQSFDALVYMRDAEIVVSNSLNSNNDNVLARRAERAKSALDSAMDKRDKVFKDYQERRISQQTTSANLSSSIESLVTELVDICGLPKSCKSSEIQKIMSKPECDPLTLPFYCGFKLDADSLPGKPAREVSSKSVLVSAAFDDETGELYYLDGNGKRITPEDVGDIFTDGFDPVSDVNTGEAAEAILAYRKARQHVDVAMADFIALQNKVAVARETADAYAQNILQRYVDRKAYIDEIQGHMDEIEDYLKGDGAHKGKLQAIIEKLDTQTKTLKENYDEESAALEKWKEIRKTQYANATKYITDIEALEREAFDLETSADIISHAFSSVAEACYVGGNLADSENRELSGKSYISSIVFHGLEGAFYTVLQGNAASVTDDKTQMERDRELAEAKIEYDNDISDEQSRVDSLRDEAEYVETINELEKTIAEADIEAELLRAEIEMAKEKFNRKDTYLRDMQALDNMRSEYKQLAQDLLAKHALVLEAKIEADNILLHYMTLAQRAMMLKSQYTASKERLAKINQLFTSPAVVFTYASDLEAVENKIELAKERIYDYLAALEYNAVRPFVDIRRAVYLSRSPNDLDAILEQLETVSDNCGGIINTVDDDHAIIVSTREMLGITADFQKMSMKERFHYVISNGNVPINSLTRYTVDITGKELLNSGHALKSGTFELTIKDFANLQATCNAKIAGFAFKLVGENLIKPDAGTQVHPTMTMFYNGKSTLASCQPDISAVVEDLGTSTAYGKYSTFDLEQTKISPNAGINEWGNNDKTLEQYPLASSYTVLIDPEIGENAKINWDNVEDIQIKVLYTYENVKSQNTCKY